MNKPVRDGMNLLPYAGCVYVIEDVDDDGRNVVNVYDDPEAAANFVERAYGQFASEDCFWKQPWTEAPYRVWVFYPQGANEETPEEDFPRVVISEWKLRRKDR